MTVGFFLVLKSDPVHYLHACALVREVKKAMPGVRVVQLTDAHTPAVLGAEVKRVESAQPLLQQRLSHYAGCGQGEWLLLDTDVHLRHDVRGVFDSTCWDVALTDRNWPHIPQGESLLHSMFFNTGVVFSRSQTFWMLVQREWEGFSEAQRADWMSEQAAVWNVAKSGRFCVKVLPGMHYNYPPQQPDSIPIYAALVHYKGPRKAWRSAQAVRTLSA